MRRRGYASVSYADLATAVGIRKASIHHHFPGKVDLGVEMVEQYTSTFLARLRTAERSGSGAVALLEFYAGLYREGVDDGLACLCGTLAAEYEAVPDDVRAGISRFFAANLEWLTRHLDHGVRMGELAAGLDPAQAAQRYLAVLQGGMLTARALGDVAVFDGIVTSSLELLRA